MHNSLENQFILLEKVKEEVIGLLKNTDEQKRQASPSPGKWSPLQIAWHVVQAETVSFKYIEKRLKNAGQYPFPSTKDRVFSWFIIFGLRFPMKLKAPVSVSVMPDKIELPDVIIHWNAARLKMKEVLDSVGEEDMQRALYVHPVAGPMNLYDAMRFMQQHQNRHSNQIKKICNQN